MSSNKMVGVLKSRKFWAAIVSLLASIGLVSADMEPQLVESLLTIVAVIGGTYILGTGVSDIGGGKA